jgi:hypothetical protein
MSRRWVLLSGIAVAMKATVAMAGSVQTPTPIPTPQKLLQAPAVQKPPVQPNALQTGSNGYTFAITPYGAVQTSKNGVIISTGTPQSAAQQYGYRPPTALEVRTPVVIQKPTFSAGFSGATSSSGFSVRLIPLTQVASTTALTNDLAATDGRCEPWSSDSRRT